MAAGTYKGTWGHHPWEAWCENTGESLALLLRKGSAGSHTTADHLTVLDEAITQIPARYRRDLLITVDGAGAFHGLIDHITTLNASPWHTVHYVIGWELGARERTAIDLVPASAWAAVLDPKGASRELGEAGVVELTGLLRDGPGGDQLARWPKGMRLIARRDKPHPGAQLSLFEEIDGWRYQLVATNTPGKTAQFLEARHRPHPGSRTASAPAKTPARAICPDVRVDLLDQLVALLVLVADVRREAAQDLANFLFSLFARTIEAAAERLKRADGTLYESVRERALSELRAGALDGLIQRSRLLQRRKPAELADFLSFADHYRTLLHDRTSELVPAYFDVQRRVSISRLYVTPGFAIVEDSSGHPYERSFIPLDAVLGQCYRTVILGDPGAGKSTLAQYLAHFYSDQGRFGPNEFGIVPFVVSLRTYEEWKTSAHGSVVDFLASNIRENFQLEVPDGAIEYLLLTGRAFVLFDGLDELINIAKRQAICDAIANFSDLYATATVLVTSRKIGYFEAPINPQRFITAILMNFSDDDVAVYVSNWFAVDDRLDRRTRETMVFSFLDESESVREIRSNALMLGLMCNLYRGVRTIPQNRVDLYEKCAEMLFERWDASRGITTSNILKADAKAALQDVALWMYTTSGLTDGVTEKQLYSRLVAFWTKRFEDHGRAAEVAQELLALWKGRTWVLTDVGSAGTDRKLVYKFTHQTFLAKNSHRSIMSTRPNPPGRRLRHRPSPALLTVLFRRLRQTRALTCHYRTREAPLLQELRM